MGTPPPALRVFIRSTVLLSCLLAFTAMTGTSALLAQHSPAWFAGGAGAPGGEVRLAFDADGDIYAVRADGRDLRQLTHGRETDFGPIWSPDGRWIAHWSRDAGTTSLVAIDMTTGERRVLVASVGAKRASASVTWSPDSTQLAFESNAGSLGAHLETVGLDGRTTPRPVRDTGTNVSDPAWSPDGSRIAFRGQTLDGGTGVFVTRHAADGSFGSGEMIRVSPPWLGGSTAWEMPAWSPDGCRIATSAGLGLTNQDLVLLSACVEDPEDQPIMQVLSASIESERWPAWSPDGSRLAFWAMSHRTSHPVLYVMSLDTGVTRLVDAPPLLDRPVHWSPDGSRILGATCQATCSIEVISADDRFPIVSVSAPGNIGSGSWQPEQFAVTAGPAASVKRGTSRDGA